MAKCQGSRAQLVKLFFGIYQYLAERCSENPQGLIVLRASGLRATSSEA